MTGRGMERTVTTVATPPIPAVRVTAAPVLAVQRHSERNREAHGRDGYGCGWRSGDRCREVGRHGDKALSESL